MLVDLKKSFSGKSAVIQLRKYIRGGTVYRTLETLTLNELGDGSYPLSAKLLKQDRLRLLVDGKKIVFHTVIVN